MIQPKWPSIAFSNRVNKDYNEIRDQFPREAELPFDSDRKLMSTVHTFEGQTALLTKGGPDVLFSRCSHVFINGEVQPLTPEIRTQFEEKNEAFSKRAFRVLAYAYKKFDDKNQVTIDDEHDLTLVGLTAMIDPPREAVYGSIEESKKAGIRTIMITGDHKTTAQAIGVDIGLAEPDDLAITGPNWTKCLMRSWINNSNISRSTQEYHLKTKSGLFVHGNVKARLQP